MTYSDPVFPFATPNFVFCHTVVIERWSLVANATDDDGWPVQTGAAEVTVGAYVSPPDPRRLDPSGEAVDTVIHVRNTVDVRHGDKVRVPDGQPLPPQLVGTFRINTVRPNQADTRLLCTRVADPVGAEQ